MKKIYNLLAVALVFLAGTATATADVDPTLDFDETKWEISESYVEEIRDGMTVVIQQGTYASWSSNGYMNPSGEFKSTVDATCIYEIKSVGTASDGTPIWVLKNVSNSQYIYSGGHTLSYNEAFQCSIMRALFDTDNERQAMDAENQGSRQTDEADNTAWIFCSAEKSDGSYTYLCYWACPAYSSYKDTNDWFVYEATPHAKTASEKLEEIYNEMFGSGFDETIYAVGNNPGNISQAIYDQLQAAYDAANEVLGVTGVSDEELLAAYDLIAAAQEAYENGKNKIKSGEYYTLQCQRSSCFMYDGGSGMQAYTHTFNEPLTISDAGYIWTVEDAGDGFFYLKNFGTGNYMGSQSSTSSQFPTTTTAEVKVEFPDYSGNIFLLQDEDGNMAHNNGAASIVRWQSTDVGNQWAIVVVDASQVDALAEQVAKNKFISELYALLAEAEATQTAYLYDSDVTFDGAYDSEKPGIVSSVKGNDDETSEGPIANLTDGSVGTFYHTNWSGETAIDDYDWVQVEFESDVQNIFMKMTQRQSNNKNAPTRYALVAPTDDDDPEGVWTDTLYRDTLIYQYSTEYSNGTTANSTAIVKLDLDKAVSKLRFVVFATKNNSSNLAKGPFWTASELHFYTNNGENPRYTLIPDEVKTELANQIANATAKLADSTCVQSDYDALEAALEAFNDAYPDDSRLTSLIEEAESQASAEGMTGTELGYFPEGAQTTLAEEVANVKTAIEGKVLTLSEIESYLNQVREAMSAFNAKLIVPEDGSFIRLKSETEDEEGEPAAAYGNYIYAVSADTAAAVKWSYKGDVNAETRLDAIWQAKKQADGSYTLRNVATGRYLHNLYTGVEDADDISLSTSITTGPNAETISFTSAKEGGRFALQLSEGIYMNADPNGPVVNWNTNTGNSAFSVEIVDPSDIIMHTQDVKAGMLQIVSLPFAAYGIQPVAYKVLGQKADDSGQAYLQLTAYSDDEEIPAGTPFVVQTSEEESILQIMLMASDGEELINGTYNYEPVTQNGMVSTVCAIKVNAGLGLLIDDVVKNSVNNTSVAAGSGYFIEIPETTEDGELTIKIEDVINGISNAEVAMPISADVYTISGMKIRSNVKTSEAVKNLPAGLYIMGGKKVLVK